LFPLQEKHELALVVVFHPMTSSENRVTPLTFFTEKFPVRELLPIITSNATIVEVSGLKVAKQFVKIESLICTFVPN